MKLSAVFKALLLASATSAQTEWYSPGPTRATLMQEYGFETDLQKMVPMLKCEDQKCAGQSVPTVVRLGETSDDDEFGTLTLPKMIFNQKWFVDRRISVLKYYDLSDELNNLGNFSVNISDFSSQPTNVTFDGTFPYISIDKNSLNETLTYLNTKIINKETQNEFVMEKQAFDHQIGSNLSLYTLVSYNTSCSGMATRIYQNSIQLHFAKYNFTIPSQDLFRETNGSCNFGLAAIAQAGEENSTTTSTQMPQNGTKSAADVNTSSASTPISTQIQLIGRPFLSSFNVVFDLSHIHKVVVWPKLADQKPQKVPVPKPKKPAHKKEHQKALKIDIPYFKAIRQGKKASGPKMDHSSAASLIQELVNPKWILHQLGMDFFLEETITEQMGGVFLAILGVNFAALLAFLSYSTLDQFRFIGWN